MAQVNDVTFINTFTVHGPQAEFEAIMWKAAEFLRGQDGFLQYTVFRRLPKSDSYVNITRWRDAGAFQRAVSAPEFTALVGTLHKLGRSDGAFFEPLLVI